ncbi:hypothetical protein LBE40_05620 [Bartonella taylorii]|uniref:Uncharacterized protein n=2 Tax=Bartonella taylorii TaxID=33046 RepID=A0A9P2RXR7_BARTA|nr:hypothetical protein [Bartonella taylorii]EJF92981.1 hypothetical protein ME9_01423 [Bartonella taylorii 8TBB]USP00775.1 hypothetical protein LBE40_05620 [Bartonella taylorii]
MQVSHALHSHDERFARTINQMSVGQDSSHNAIEIVEIKRANELQELTTTVDTVSTQTKSESARRVIGTAESKFKSAYKEQGELFHSSEFVDFIKIIFLESFEITDYWLLGKF